MTLKTMKRVLDAWNSTILEKHRDGLMQEVMEELRADIEEAERDRPDAGVWHSPTTDDARRVGEVGGCAVEAERAAFEAWMAGHCWTVGGEWNGSTYVHHTERDRGCLDSQTMLTRMMWAAWRDRATLANTGLPTIPTYPAELDRRGVQMLQVDSEGAGRWSEIDISHLQEVMENGWAYRILTVKEERKACRPEQ